MAKGSAFSSKMRGDPGNRITTKCVCEAAKDPQQKVNRHKIGILPTTPLGRRIAVAKFVARYLKVHLAEQVICGQGGTVLVRTTHRSALR